MNELLVLANTNSTACDITSFLYSKGGGDMKEGLRQIIIEALNRGYLKGLENNRFLKRKYLAAGFISGAMAVTLLWTIFKLIRKLRKNGHKMQQECMMVTAEDNSNSVSSSVSQLDSEENANGVSSLCEPETINLGEDSTEVNEAQDEGSYYKKETRGLGDGIGLLKLHNTIRTNKEG